MRRTPPTRPTLLQAVTLCAVAACALVTASCGEEPREQPTPPNMSALVATYQNPSADLTPAVMDQVTSDTIAGIDQLGTSVEFATVLIDTIVAGFEGPAEEEEGFLKAGLQRREQALALSADGFVEITRICNGWEGATTPNTADGQIQLTAVANEGGLNPVVWGTMRDCKYRLSDVNTRFDSAVSIYVGAAVGTDGSGLGQSPILIALDGDIALGEDIQLNGAYDLQVDIETGAVETRLGLDDGSTLILSIVDDTLQYRAANGLWTCDFEGRTCTEQNGETFAW